MWTKRHRHGSARMMAYVREKVSRRPKFRRFLSLANAGCQRQAVSEIPPNAGWNTLMYLGIFIFDPCWSILIYFDPDFLEIVVTPSAVSFPWHRLQKRLYPQQCKTSIVRCPKRRATRSYWQPGRVSPSCGIFTSKRTHEKIHCKKTISTSKRSCKNQGNLSPGTSDARVSKLLVHWFYDQWMVHQKKIRLRPSFTQQFFQSKDLRQVLKRNVLRCRTLRMRRISIDHLDVSWPRKGIACWKPSS